MCDINIREHLTQHSYKSFQAWALNNKNMYCLATFNFVKTYIVTTHCIAKEETCKSTRCLSWQLVYASSERKTDRSPVEEECFVPALLSAIRRLEHASQPLSEIPISADILGMLWIIHSL